MPKPANRPNAEQSKLFDEYVAKWQAILSLGDWRIERVKNRTARGSMAMVEFDNGQHLASYKLGDFGSEEITPESLEKTAIHELLHIFLHDLIHTAQNRDTTEEQLEVAEHRVINVLEKLLAEYACHRK